MFRKMYMHDSVMCLNYLTDDLVKCVFWTNYLTYITGRAGNIDNFKS